MAGGATNQVGEEVKRRGDNLVLNILKSRFLWDMQFGNTL